MGDVVISGIHSTSQSIHVQAGLATSMSDVIQSVQYRTTPRDVNGIATGTPARDIWSSRIPINDLIVFVYS